VPTAAEQIPPPTGAANQHLRYWSFPDVGHGIKILTTDEDGHARPAWTQRVIDAINWLTPFTDAHFSFPVESKQFLEETFAPHFPKPHFTWPDLTDVDNLTLFILQGIGSHRLERTEQGLALRMEFMSAFEVREGLARYGGDALLGEDGKLQALVFGGTRFAPEHPDFSAQAFRFRSTVITAVTLFDHLGVAHYGVGNALLGATRRRLSPDHPLRIWLKPHIFRTGAINANSTSSLLPDRGLFHRGLSFVRFSDLRRRLLDYAFYEPLPAALRRQGIHPEQLPVSLAVRLPYSMDSLEYWTRLEAYVHACLTESKTLSRVLDGGWGEETRVWWNDLSKQINKGLPSLDRESLAAVTTWLLFVVTAFHGHVGHVAPYVRDATVFAGRPFAGAVMADVQNSLQMGVVTTLTGLKVPCMNGDLSHAMPDASALSCYGRFRQTLAELQEEIDTRNARRPLPFPAFSPRVMPCSVSR